MKAKLLLVLLLVLLAFNISADRYPGYIDSTIKDPPENPYKEQII